MFFLFGLSTREHLEFSRAATCRYCGVHALQKAIVRKTRFTVFFIPLLTVKKSRLQVCINCGGTTRISGSEQKALAG